MELTPEVIMIVLYLAVVLVVIGIFLAKSRKQQEEIEDRLDDLENDEAMYYGRRFFRRRHRR